MNDDWAAIGTRRFLQVCGGIPPTDENMRQIAGIFRDALAEYQAAATLRFTVPGVPPGLNMYVRHTRGGGHFLTPEAQRFKRDVAYVVRNQTIEGRTFEVEIVVYFGKKNKGDVDGLGKLTLDAMAEIGVFRAEKPGKRGGIHYERQPLTDNCVSDCILRKRRDRDNPRTEITVRRTEVDV